MAITNKGLNPFEMKVQDLHLDLLTDSGTNLLYPEQVKMKELYKKHMQSIDIFSYARSAPSILLDQILKKAFGDEFNYYPALQGRAAERLLIHGLTESGLMNKDELILANRAFDTTTVMIERYGLKIDNLTPFNGV